LLQDGEFQKLGSNRTIRVDIRLLAAREDVPLLAHHLAQKYAHRFNKTIEAISVEAIHALTDRDWPGNIRELEILIEQSVIHSEGSVLEIAHGIARAKKSAG
jgi:formate hydrogenlyase transcriptional activator